MMGSLGKVGGRMRATRCLSFLLLLAAVAAASLLLLSPAGGFAGQASAAPLAAGPESAAQPTGIWVTGHGLAVAPPDLAVLSLGVQATADTAAEAHSDAAVSMDGLLSVLADQGVADEDIQTSRFTIRPDYRGIEVTRCPEDPDGGEGQDSQTAQSALSEGCYTTYEEMLVGYRVSHSLTVKVRDLQAVGDIIDGTTAAAGDHIRVDNIRFAIEDTTVLEEQARADAVADMQDKAKQLASLAGVGLGPLLFISEGAGSVAPEQPDFLRIEAAQAFGSAASTSIASGELRITVVVQGIFGIAPGDD